MRLTRRQQTKRQRGNESEREDDETTGRTKTNDAMQKKWPESDDIGLIYYTNEMGDVYYPRHSVIQL